MERGKRATKKGREEDEIEEVLFNQERRTRTQATSVQR
jgi:hypothetical protein